MRFWAHGSGGCGDLDLRDLHDVGGGGRDLSEDFGEALLGDEALDGFAGFGVVGDDDAGTEEAGKDRVCDETHSNGSA